MSDDPQRLMDDPSAGAFGRELLASARGDAPSAESRRRVAGALGIASMGVGSTAAAAGGAGWMLKAMAIAVVVIGGGIAVQQKLASRSSGDVATGDIVAPAGNVAEGDVVRPAGDPAPLVIEPGIARPPAPLAPAAPAAADPRVADVLRVVDQSARPLPPSRPEPPARSVTAPRPHPPREPERAAPEAPAPETLPARPSESPSEAEAVKPAAKLDARSLAAEVASLDRARAAMRGGNLADADAALEAYAASFPAGSLAAEAAAVRIELRVAQHRSDDARRLATEFAASYPTSPLAARIRALVENAR